jgi:hypothetical protein
VSTAPKPLDESADAAIAQRLVDLDHAIADARKLASRNVARFRPFSSPHELYGVLAEEMAELFDEVRMREDRRSLQRLRAELIDIAVVALRGAAEVQAMCATVGSKRCWRCGRQFIGSVACNVPGAGQCEERSI